MKLFFHPQPIFDLTSQKKLRELTDQALSNCKVQFSASNGHAEPDCHFHIAGQYGNTGGLHGTHVTFSDTRNMEDFLDEPDRLRQLIHHELVHFFQAHRRGMEPFQFLPTWFHEGMAVALSGQGLTARKDLLDEDLAAIGGDNPWKKFFLMAEGRRDLDFSKSPYDILYDGWGALFIYAVSEQSSIFPDHVVVTEDALSSKVGAAECTKALAIIDATRRSTFEDALKKHSSKVWSTESGFRDFLWDK